LDERFGTFMNIAAIALPYRELLSWNRIRGLYNGVGYVVAMLLIQASWGSAQDAMPQLLAGQMYAFCQQFFTSAGWSLLTMLPAPAVMPLLVNLAPRAPVLRVAYRLTGVIFLAWWCLAVVEGVHFGWDVNSLGFTLEGVLTVGLGVGVCAYHSSTREASDSLLRTRIERAGLEAELQHAQLRLLRAQIEPHFLFNTLSVVRALARNDPAATVEILDNVIRYFEAALPRLRENEVALMQELQLIDAYLKIYRARMGTRLTYEIVLPEDLAQVRVPSMILLTLVENALKHGVNPSVEGGIIRVSAVSEGNSIRLAVADSGPGLDFREGRGTGLANIRQRLLMMYGRAAVLSLKPAEPRGVVASIAIPVP
jgi:signal transduction histidine kinase